MDNEVLGKNKKSDSYYFSIHFLINDKKYNKLIKNLYSRIKHKLLNPENAKENSKAF
jgi:hypothetical protein